MDSETTKREFIEAYFEDLERRIGFLAELEASGHDDEAQLLALVYLDGLANWLRHGIAGSARNFTDVLIAHGGDEQFGLVVLRWLLKQLPWKSAPKGAKAAVESALSGLPGGETYLIPELLDALRPTLSQGHLKWLGNEAWRGTVANVAYTALRSPGVHQLGTGHGISFGESTRHGKVLDRVDLERLLAALQHVFAHARQISLATNDWFGIKELLP